jgi:hypothetical protein
VFRLAILGAVALAAGCGRPLPCTSSSLCQRGAVCAPDGACRARDPGDARFAAASFVPAVDWGVTRRDRAHEVLPETDVLPLGGPGDARVHLAFAPLPETSRIGRAVVWLVPHESWAPPEDEVVLAFHQTAPLHATTLTRRNAPRITSRPLVEAAIAPGATRAIRADVTEAVRDAIAVGARRISLAIVVAEAPGRGTFRFASPRALDARARPRLEVLIR